MIKTLRTPTIFVFLTIVIAGWISAWKLNPQPALRDIRLNITRTSTRPIYNFIHGNFQLNYRQEPVCIERTHNIQYAIQTESGVSLITTSRPNLWPTTHGGETILAAGTLHPLSEMTEFGLLGIIITRKTRLTIIQQVASYPEMSPQDVYDAYVSPTQAGQYTFDGSVSTSWRWSPLAVAHDVTFLLALIAYLNSIAGIPSWLIWKRLTKTHS